VQNDPVNFVDPSGLNMSSGGGSCWLSWSATAWYQGDRFLGITNFSYSISCTGGSSSGSGNIGSSGGGRGGTPAPLTPKENKKLQKAIDKVKKNLDKKKCRDFLESKGISLDDLRTTLDTHGRYSGERSTGITIEQAGVLDPAEVELAKTAPPSASLTKFKKDADTTVGRYFADRPTLSALAARWSTPQSVYYRTLDQENALHESLHLLTGKNDKNLAQPLTENTYTDKNAAVGAINTALRDNKCIK
jgi:hypothetical protein